MYPCRVATALTVYGIETPFRLKYTVYRFNFVATALTVYGIETPSNESCLSKALFTVLKPAFATADSVNFIELQQYLPFTVLKLVDNNRCTADA